MKTVIQDIYTIYDGEDKRLAYANAGENVRFKLQPDNKHIQRGFVICTQEQPVPIVKKFEANMQVIDLLDHKPIMSAGYKCVFHIHTAMDECMIEQVNFEVNLATRKTKKVNFAKIGSNVNVEISVRQGICMEIYKTLPYFGRFTLRDEGRTIAIGKVTKILEGKEPEGESSEEEGEHEEGEESEDSEEEAKE